MLNNTPPNTKLMLSIFAIIISTISAILVTYSFWIAESRQLTTFIVGLIFVVVLGISVFILRSDNE